MSDPDSKIDKLFGDRLRDDEFAFREEHWEKMEKLLDSQPRRPVPFFRWSRIVPALIITTALVGGATFLFMQDSDDTIMTGNREVAVAESSTPGSGDQQAGDRQPSGMIPPAGVL